MIYKPMYKNEKTRIAPLPLFLPARAPAPRFFTNDFINNFRH